MIEIKDYHSNYKVQVEKLKNEIFKCYPSTIFWNLSDYEFTWKFCSLLFKNGELIGKGQIQPIFVATPGINELGTCHKIFINIKLHPDYIKNEDYYDALYKSLWIKGQEIKRNLPQQFNSLLCVGNFASEVEVNHFFETKGFSYHESLYSMERNLNDPILTLELFQSIEIEEYLFNTEQEIAYYLKLNGMIWPDAQLDVGRLNEYRDKRHFKCFVAKVEGVITGSVMAFVEENIGVIEDVFVLPAFRNRGIARYLLIDALNYLKELKLEKAELTVLVNNVNALGLYQSFNFKIMDEEKRYFIDYSD